MAWGIWTALRILSYPLPVRVRSSPVGSVRPPMRGRLESYAARISVSRPTSAVPLRLPPQPDEERAPAVPHDARRGRRVRATARGRGDRMRLGARASRGGDEACLGLERRSAKKNSSPLPVAGIIGMDRIGRAIASSAGSVPRAARSIGIVSMALPLPSRSSRRTLGRMGRTSIGAVPRSGSGLAPIRRVRVDATIEPWQRRS